MIIFAGIISTLIMVFGMEGRGDWSKNISIVGGILWLGSIVWAFYVYGLKSGIFFVIGTFVWGAILMNILRPLLNPHGR